MTHSENLKEEMQRLVIPCQFCSSPVTKRGKAWVNFNRGDSLITPHFHINFVYECQHCGQKFIVRLYVRPKLYYGELLETGEVFDMKPGWTEKGVIPGRKRDKDGCMVNELVDERLETLNLGHLALESESERKERERVQELGWKALAQETKPADSKAGLPY